MKPSRYFIDGIKEVPGIGLIFLSAVVLFVVTLIIAFFAVTAGLVDRVFGRSLSDSRSSASLTNDVQTHKVRLDSLTTGTCSATPANDSILRAGRTGGVGLTIVRGN